MLTKTDLILKVVDFIKELENIGFRFYKNNSSYTKTKLLDNVDPDQKFHTLCNYYYYEVEFNISKFGSCSILLTRKKRNLRNDFCDRTTLLSYVFEPTQSLYGINDHLIKKLHEVSDFKSEFRKLKIKRVLEDGKA